MTDQDRPGDERLDTAEAEAAREAAQAAGRARTAGGSGRKSRKGELVTIEQGAAGRVEAGEVSVERGAIGLARAGHVEVHMGAVGAALGERVELHQGLTRLAASTGSVRLEQAGAGTVIANEVTFGPRSGTVVLIARRVEGDVRTLFDWRAGAAFGLVAGLVLSLLRRR